MGIASIIRAVANGSAVKPRAAADDTEDMEEDAPDPAAADEDQTTDAADDDPQPDAEDDAPEPDAEDDEPDGDEPANMSAGERRAYAAGMAAQQARIASIMGCEQADANPKLAAHLAFATKTSAKDARAMLKAGAMTPDVQGGGRGNLASRMQRAPNPKVGGGSGASQPKDQPGRIFAAASQMIAAKKRA